MRRARDGRRRGEHGRLLLLGISLQLYGSFGNPHVVLWGIEVLLLLHESIRLLLWGLPIRMLSRFGFMRFHNARKQNAKIPENKTHKIQGKTPNMHNTPIQHSTHDTAAT